MNTPETLVLSGLPPCLNHAYRKRGAGFGMYMVAAAKAWKEAAMLEVLAQRIGQDWRKHDIAVSILYEMHRPLSSDIDGRTKLCLDALAEGLGFDDRYVAPLHQDRKRVKGEERTLIVVSERGEP